MARPKKIESYRILKSERISNPNIKIKLKTNAFFLTDLRRYAFYMVGFFPGFFWVYPKFGSGSFFVP